MAAAVHDNGEPAWPPMFFDKPVAKLRQFLALLTELHIHPGLERFDIAIVRSVGQYFKAAMFGGLPEPDIVMGAVWQTTPFERAELWPVLQRTAELGAMTAAKRKHACARLITTATTVAAGGLRCAPQPAPAISVSSSPASPPSSATHLSGRAT